MPDNTPIYNNIEEKSRKKILNSLHSSTHTYSPTETIAYSIKGRNIIGIMEEGKANIIRFDFDGIRTIIEELEQNDIFSDMFFDSNGSDLSVIATTICKVTFIEYDKIFLIRQSENYNMFVSNLFKCISKKLVKRNERIELLTTRSIRNKLLTYFELQTKKKNSKSFNLDCYYTDLADYLAIDRSAMMRELKNLKEDKIITDINKKITLLY